MGTIKTFRELIVWQKSMHLVTQNYWASGNFPKSEFYGLISQLRRSAALIPSNIAEEYGRRSIEDYVSFLQNFVGSLYELQTQLEIAKKLGHHGKPGFHGFSWCFMISLILHGFW